MNDKVKFHNMTKPIKFRRLKQMKWTNEQLQAINDSGENIIVSAGAGSGKTAVLTQRVITKLKNGININNLLILTFTNAAAAEMKERIRTAIKKDSELTTQLDYIDSAYITTFDSFSMSVVKKYYYLHMYLILLRNKNQKMELKNTCLMY